MASKHDACRGHVKLECGCKVCARSGFNADSKGVIPEAHVAQLTKFHAIIHRLWDRHHKAAAKRNALLDKQRRIVKVSRKAAQAHVIPQSKLHRHTKRCRMALDQQFTGYYRAPLPSVTTALVIGGERVDTPPHIRLNITQATFQPAKPSYKRESRVGNFPKSPLMVAFEKCKVTGAPIPAKRVPAILTKTYKAWQKEQVNA